MDIYVGRQPIFTWKLEVAAYELLFRSGEQNRFSATDPDHATAKVIQDTFLVMGLDRITGGKRGYINFTEGLLKSNVAELLPPEAIGVEILETIVPDADLVERCRALKANGYLIVLDDFVYEERFEPLVELADVIKIDFLASDETYQRTFPKRFQKDEKVFLAEKIETEEMFRKAKAWGYTLFQGYFFSKPSIVKGQDLPSTKLGALRLLQRISDPTLEFSELAEIIKLDVSVTVKLFKLLSAIYPGRGERFATIRDALVALGEKRLRRWMALLAVQELSMEKPSELMRMALVRARFCETISHRLNWEDLSDQAFLMGMLSLLDAMTDHPMEELLKDLSIPDSVKTVLVSQTGDRLISLLSLIKAIEQMDAFMLPNLTNYLKLNPDGVRDDYLAALAWAGEIVS